LEVNPVPPINLKEMSDDELVQLIADASAELNWRRRVSKPLGWVEDIKRNLKGGDPIA
jgi:hypothetical protein